MAPRKLERQLTAECCRTRGSSALPSSEVPAWIATGEPDMCNFELDTLSDG